MELLAPSRVSHTLSRYGDRAITILPSVLPAALLQRREGFTDLSRLVDGIAPAPGNVTYPTRNFAQFCCPSQVSEWGPDISAGLCMSPCSSDFLFDLLRHRRSSGVKSLRISHQKLMRSFLLIICTPSIVTADCSASSWRFSDVPAYGQILLRQRSHLRTVIVTAAVYRGFGSVLCPLRS